MGSSQKNKTKIQLARLLKLFTPIVGQPLLTPFVCGFDRQQFRSVSAFLQHLGSVHITGNLATTQSVVDHDDSGLLLRCGDIESNPGPTTQTTHACPKCKRTFKSKPALKQHMTSHTSLVSNQNYEKNKKGKSKQTNYLRAAKQFSNKALSVGADVRAIENHIGRGGEAGLWAMMALDPMAEAVVGGCRIPDKTVGSTTAFISRSDVTISAPAGISSTELWDCLIIQLPIPETPYWYITKRTGSLFAPDLSGSQIITMPNLWSGYAANNSMIMTGQKGSPTFLSLAESFRTTHKGLSIMFDSSALYDQGRVFGGQMKAKPTETIEDVVDAGETLKLRTLSFDQMPIDQGTIFAAVPEMTRYKAKHGIYMPARFTDPTHQFVNSSGLAKPLGQADPRAIRINLNFVDSEGTYYSQFLQDPRGPPTGNQCRVSGVDNTQIGVVLFTSMHYTATLDVKVIMGVEAQVDPTSPWTPFVGEAPDPDEGALEQQIMIQDRLPVAYPERYNAWGALIPIIGQVLGSIATWGVGKITNWMSNRVRQPSKMVDIPLD